MEQENKSNNKQSWLHNQNKVNGIAALWGILFTALAIWWWAYVLKTDKANRDYVATKILQVDKDITLPLNNFIDHHIADLPNGAVVIGKDANWVERVMSDYEVDSINSSRTVVIKPISSNNKDKYVFVTGIYSNDVSLVNNSEFDKTTITSKRRVWNKQDIKNLGEIIGLLWHQRFDEKIEKQNRSKGWNSSEVIENRKKESEKYAWRN